MKVQVKISHVQERGYRAWCPALPGCKVWGQSRDEALEKIRLAVRGYLASLEVALPRQLQRLSITTSGLDDRFDVLSVA